MSYEHRLMFDTTFIGVIVVKLNCSSTELLNNVCLFSCHKQTKKADCTTYFISVCLFQVTIYCAGQRYNVSVNGQQIHSYNHRFWQFSEIDVFEIFGDLQLTSVQV